MGSQGGELIGRSFTEIVGITGGLAVQCKKLTSKYMELVSTIKKLKEKCFPWYSGTPDDIVNNVDQIAAEIEEKQQKQVSLYGKETVKGGGVVKGGMVASPSFAITALALLFLIGSKNR